MPDELAEDQRIGSLQRIRANSPRRRSADWVSAYANQAQITSSPFDVRLAFSEMQPDEAGELIALERATIVMSPQHAKIMLLLFNQNIVRWEEKFGQIDLTKFMKLGGVEQDPDKIEEPK